MTAPRIALVHDWLDTWRGGENVLAEIVRLVPDADLFALVDFLGTENRRMLLGKRARTTFLQHMPLARRHFRLLLPLFPKAIESLDLRGYELVISVSHAVAKNVRVTATQQHLCYCLTPMRYAWDIRDQYLAAGAASSGAARWITERVLDRLQQWDRAASARVTRFMAISSYIAGRIQRAYGREAEVVYPPVDTDYFHPGAGAPRDYYFTASRWVPYKRVDAIVAAFRGLGHLKLIVAGDGPEARRVRAAAGPNVQFVGEVDRARLRDLMRGARAFVFAAEEDFGIVPLEAQACGTPVLALARGATLETIRTAGERATGLFFDSQEPAAIADAVERFENVRGDIEPAACRDNALRFSVERFRREFGERLKTALGHRARAPAL